MRLFVSDIDKLNEATKIVKKYFGKWQLDPKERKELDDALKIILDYQAKCSHFDKKEYVGFTRVGWVCEDCGYYQDRGDEEKKK